MNCHQVIVTIISLLALTGFSCAQLPEIEANETKAQATANGAFVLDATSATNFGVTGSTTGSSTTVAGAASADTYVIQTAPLPPGIYQHDLTVTTTGTAGHTGTIRGVTQFAGLAVPGTDLTFQTSSTTTSAGQANSNLAPRSNRWYGFGKGEKLFYRVTGSASTAAAYVSTLATTPVTPLSGGIYVAGPITITTVGQIPAATVDTDLWVYDSNFNAIPNFGNDDEFGTASLDSRLTRGFAPGTYYIALTAFQLANNQTAPLDDDFRNGGLMDFPDIASHSSSLPTTATSADISLNFSITDCVGTQSFITTKPGSYGIRWIQITVLPAPIAWEVNSPECNLDIDDIQNHTAGPLDVSKCLTAYSRVHFKSTLAGNAWDLGLTTFSGVAASSLCGPGTGGFNTAGGQAFNLNLLAPDLVFLNGLSFNQPFPGDFLLPFASTVVIPNVSGQMMVLDPAHLDGIQLSALNQLHYVATTTLGAPVPGPAGDDSFITVDIGCFAFYGRSFTQIFPTSNGRVNFIAGDTDFSVTVAEAVGDTPFAGAWCDLNPTIAGSGQIDITSPAASIIRINYNGVRYFGSTLATQIATYGIQLDGNNGIVTIDGLGGITASTQGMFLGISKGLLGAVDAGPTAFSVSGPNMTAGGHDMIYSFGPAGSLTPGMSSLIFIPVVYAGGIEGYSWTGM